MNQMEHERAGSVDPAVEIDDSSTALMDPQERGSSEPLRGQTLRKVAFSLSGIALLVTLGFCFNARGNPEPNQIGKWPESLIANAVCSAPQDNTNNGGANIKSVGANSVETCCTACLETPGCVGYTLTKGSEGWGGECWLKSNMDSPHYDAGAMSASVVVGKPWPPKGTLAFSVEECTHAGGCQAKRLALTVDQSSRKYFNPATGKKCGPCGKSNCTECVLEEEFNYAKNGVSVSDDEKTLTLIKHHQIYLMDDDGWNYYMADLVGKEFSYDIDLSKTPCGAVMALYFVEMPKDGGCEGGARKGTGYCDAHCTLASKTLWGKPVSSKRHLCCNEFDVMEANREAAYLTQHTCVTPEKNDMKGVYECWDKDSCNTHELQGLCDGVGCDINPYRNGDTRFYKPGADATGVNTLKPFTVTTQFVADAAGNLVDVRRIYTQDGKKIPLPTSHFQGKSFTSMTDDYCEAMSTEFRPKPQHNHTRPIGARIYKGHGGLASTGRSLQRGNALTFSLYNDLKGGSTWLDGKKGKGAGSVRGPCGTRDDSKMLGKDGSIGVVVKNLKFGEIGSTA